MFLTKLDVIRRLMKQRVREGHLRPARQLAEVLALWAGNGVGPTMYYAAGLYRAEIPWREKREYIGYARYRRALARLNPEQFRCMSRNKIVTAGLLQLFNIPTPRFLGHLSSTVGQTHDAYPLRSSADLENMMNREKIKQMCFKPITGYGGRGFVRASVRIRNGNGLRVAIEPERAEMNIKEFHEQFLPDSRGRGYFCQDIVEQHPVIAELNPSSVNTARVWLRKDSNHRWSIFGAYFRMGIGPVVVDSTSAGGLASPIDLATGKLSDAIDNKPQRQLFHRHPHTGCQINGRVVPHWEETKRVCVRTGFAFDYLNLLGLDIAFGVHGPLVLEVNEEPNSRGQVSMGRGIAPVIASDYIGGGENGSTPGKESHPEVAHEIRYH